MSPLQSQNGAFNLDKAAAAARAEAEGGQPFRFTYKGHKYQLPPIKTWTIDAQSHLAGGRFDMALTALLGRREYEQLVRDGIIQAELEVLFENLGAEAGIPGLGNSAAPQQHASTPT